MPKSISTNAMIRHFEVSKAILSTDIASGFFVGLFMDSAKGKARKWGEKEFIFAHFFLKLSGEGMAKKDASKRARMLIDFMDQNPKEECCALVSREGDNYTVAMPIDKVPDMKKWADPNNNIESVSIYRVGIPARDFENMF